MPRKGQCQSEEARKLISLAVRERMMEEGWRPFQKRDEWSHSEEDEARMRKWREELR